MYANRRQGSPLDSILVRLIIANAVVFFIQMMPFSRSFMGYLLLSPRLVVTRGYVWQLVTYMFLHADLPHLAVNMFIIWMFGRTLEKLWGGPRFLRFYFACGLGGAIFSFIFAFNTTVLGASAAAMGILLAFAILFPNQQLLLWFVIPMRARTLAILLIAFELVAGIRGGGIIAHFAHLGGMAAAIVMLRNEYQLRRVRNTVRDWFGRFPVKISLDRDGNRPPAGNTDDTGADGDRIDSILDKISEKGYENLSETERRILEKYSEQHDSDDPGTLH